MRSFFNDFAKKQKEDKEAYSWKPSVDNLS